MRGEANSLLSKPWSTQKIPILRVYIAPKQQYCSSFSKYLDILTKSFNVKHSYETLDVIDPFSLG